MPLDRSEWSIGCLVSLECPSVRSDTVAGSVLGVLSGYYRVLFFPHESIIQDPGRERHPRPLRAQGVVNAAGAGKRLLLFRKNIIDQSARDCSLQRSRL